MCLQKVSKRTDNDRQQRGFDEMKVGLSTVQPLTIKEHLVFLNMVMSFGTQL